MAPTTSASTHVNPAPTPEVGAIAEGSIRQRGPVEEVIAKRMKQIGKKLQRYRGYISADPATLNKDQKEALISLPALEGAYKELEDLVRDKGPVEEQELIQAAKLREATEAAKAAALAEAGASTDAFKTSLVQPLSLFLKLYALLHPARPSDHEHLTFSALSLPPRLQDEVQATDVLRVGRIYEDITLGGQAAISALEGLVNGPKGEDEENDHVHHLLQLLSQPEEATEGVTEETTEDYTAAALVTSTEEAVEAVPEAVVPEEENELVNGHASQQPTINFLQADELDTKPDQVDQEPVQSETKTETVEAVEAPLEAPSSSRAALDFAPATSSNWADLDDDDVPAQSTQTQSVPVEITPTAPIEQSTVSEIPHAESNSVEAATEAGAPKEAGNAKPPRGPRTKKPSNRGKPQNRQTSQRPAQSESGPKKDDDGFETVRRAPPPAVSGGRGRGGRGGNGASRGGRGRGGATNGTRPNGATGTGRPSNDRQSSQTGQGAAKEAKPKASIYKTVQPSGPVSAPIH